MFSSLGIYFIFSLSKYRSLNMRLEVSLLDCFSNLNSSTSISNLSFAFSKSLYEWLAKIFLICSSWRFKSVCLDSSSSKLAFHSCKIRSYLSSPRLFPLRRNSLVVPRWIKPPIKIHSVYYPPSTFKMLLNKNLSNDY